MEKVDVKEIDKVASALKRGAVIVYPTETSYGLGCDATNTKAVERIFLIKGRPKSKGLVVLARSVEDALQYVEMSKKAEMLAREHWPGPLNLVLPIQEDSSIIRNCSREQFQAMRVSSHPFVQKLMKVFDRPLVSTSANVSGEEAIYNAGEVMKIFADQEFKPDLVVDGGVIPKRPGSTVVRVEDDLVTVLRKGEIKL